MVMFLKYYNANIANEKRKDMIQDLNKLEILSVDLKKKE